MDMTGELAAMTAASWLAENNRRRFGVMASSAARREMVFRYAYKTVTLTVGRKRKKAQTQ